jgi:regulator of protease activity HflC (stomatin/prohibitin superfamily)
MFPIVERVGARINVQESVLDIPQQQVITKDNAIVSVDGVAFYQVVDARAAAYEVRNLVQAITNLALTNIRNVMGSLALDDVLSKRNEINDRLLSVIDHATNAWGIKVLRIELKDIIPPQDMVQAMARQMKAERDKRAQILEAEGVREAQIKRAEGEKQAAILSAEGRREAAFRDAEARERAAEAEAKATQVVTAAIGSGGAQAINYFLGQKYVEALHAMGSSNNSKVFFLPIEATGIMGTLGGLAELTKESQLRGAQAAASLPPPASGGSPPPVPSGPWNRG